MLYCIYMILLVCPFDKLDIILVSNEYIPTDPLFISIAIL